MDSTDRDVAARCLDDPRYARAVLNGDEHPRVREAILADWQGDPEVTGYFNPQPDPPGFPADIQRVSMEAFSQTWTTLPRTNLQSLAGKG